MPHQRRAINSLQADVEDFHDAFRGNLDAVKEFDELASDCEKRNIQILRIVESGVMPPGTVEWYQIREKNKQKEY